MHRHKIPWMANNCKRNRTCGIRRDRSLRVEALEPRLLLSTDPYTWIGGISDEWQNGKNWHNGVNKPGDGDTAVFTSLGQRDPRLTEDTTVGAINAETGSDLDINLNGHTLETKLTAGDEYGIRVNDGDLSGMGAKLEIINTGAGPKTVTTPTVIVGLLGQGHDRYAEMSITTSNVKLECSGDLMVGGKMNRGTLTLKHGETQAKNVMVSGATEPAGGDDYSGKINLGTNAKLTSPAGVCMGQKNNGCPGWRWLLAG